MLANSVRQYGSPEIIEYSDAYPVPKLYSNSVLVEIKASTINPIDCKVRGGYGRRLFAKKRGSAFPYFTGSEFSGVVVDVASGVRNFKVGDSVMGSIGPALQGTNADYRAVPVTHLVRKPDGLGYNEAATLPYSSSTLAAMLRKS